ncbi:MAG: hypothetical protein RL145_1331 [Pseudomonadota bacterium]
MRHVIAALSSSLLIACVLQPVSVTAQAAKMPAAQAKAPAKTPAKAKPAPKAEWGSPTTAPTEASTAPATEAVTETAAPSAPAIPSAPPAAEVGAPDGLRAAQATVSDAPQVPKPIDESEELLAIDRAFAESLAAQGPLKSYEALMSNEGILHDASGSSPAGAAGAQARFATFPADVTLERSPESAMASGGSGSSWGRYVIRRGDNQLSLGRYVTVWRLEAGGWLIVSELAAGRAGPQAAASAGPLPRKPPSVAPRTAPTAPRN